MRLSETLFENQSRMTHEQEEIIRAVRNAEMKKREQKRAIIGLAVTLLVFLALAYWMGPK